MLASGVAGNVGTAAGVTDWPATYVIEAKATRAERAERAIMATKMEEEGDSRKDCTKGGG